MSSCLILYVFFCSHIINFVVAFEYMLVNRSVYLQSIKPVFKKLFRAQCSTISKLSVLFLFLIQISFISILSFYFLILSSIFFYHFPYCLIDFCILNGFPFLFLVQLPSFPHKFSGLFRDNVFLLLIVFRIVFLFYLYILSLFKFLVNCSFSSSLLIVIFCANLAMWSCSVLVLIFLFNSE